MPFKLNISEKGKAWKIELTDETLVGKSVGDSVSGADIKPELSGYELLITGGSDTAGFPLSQKVEGIGLKRLLLTYGWGMRENREGPRRRKTVRGKTISVSTSQINLNVTKSGSKTLAEVFPDQNQPAAPKAVPAPTA